MVVLAALIISYCLGSIPSAVWIGKWSHGIDVREHGSNNAGATNCFRVLGNKIGVLVLLSDVVKGIVSMLIAIALLKNTSNDLFLMLAAAACVLGHVFPIFAGFRGGKGVATSLGVFLGLNPWTALVCIGVFIVTFAVTRFVSLSSITAAFFLPWISFFVFKQHEPVTVVFNIAIATLVILAHRKNIRRLINGEEKQMNFKTPKM